MKFYRITAKSKALCNEIDEDAFIIDLFLPDGYG